MSEKPSNNGPDIHEQFNRRIELSSAIRATQELEQYILRLEQGATGTSERYEFWKATMDNLGISSFHEIQSRLTYLKDFQKHQIGGMLIVVDHSDEEEPTIPPTEPPAPQ
jgi:hypothetical protein